MNPQQTFWLGSDGDAYTERVQAFGNYEYTDGNRFDIIKRILSNIPRDLNILELGCNRGNFIGFLKELGFTGITGLEINETAFKICKKRFPEFNFINSAIENFNTNRKYDLVLTCCVLIHIHQKNIQNIVDHIKKLSSKYIFGNEYYSETFKEIKWPGYCLSGNYPELFKIKPKKMEIHETVKRLTAPRHVFYLIEK